jgi:hypothetical protein
MKDCERSDIVCKVFDHNENLMIDGYTIEVLRVRPHEWIDNNDLTLEVLLTVNKDETVRNNK